MCNPRFSIPYLQVRSDCFLYYESPVDTRNGGNPDIAKLKTYTGAVTTGARKRIRRAVDLLIQASPNRIIHNPITNQFHPFRLSFTTLTIPENISNARYCNEKLLQPILRKLRSSGVKSYIWKLELQKRGSVHYHITSNSFIDYRDLRNDWNTILRRKGHLKEFYLKTGHSDPNSVDVHSVYQVRDMAAYLQKYLSKADDTGKALKAKIWDCSANLKSQKFYSTICDSVLWERVNENVRTGKLQAKALDNCIIYRRTGAELSDIFEPSEIQSYFSHIQNL